MEPAAFKPACARLAAETGPRDEDAAAMAGRARDAARLHRRARRLEGRLAREAAAFADGALAQALDLPHAYDDIAAARGALGAVRQVLRAAGARADDPRQSAMRLDAAAGGIKAAIAALAELSEIVTDVARIRADLACLRAEAKQAAIAARLVEDFAAAPRWRAGTREPRPRVPGP